MATTVKDDTQESFEYKLFKALNNFVVDALVSFNDADTTTANLLQAMSDYKKFLSTAHYFQILISIKSICERNEQRRQLTLAAIQNISYILEQFPIKPNSDTKGWSGLDCSTIFGNCLNYLQNVYPHIIWIYGDKPFYYNGYDWTFGKFTCRIHDTNRVQPTVHSFANVKHDTTVENILKMIDLTSPTFIKMGGYINDVFKGPCLLWWAPDISAGNEVDCPSFFNDESRYGSVRITIPLQQLLQLVKGNCSKLYFYALGTRQYPRERCHSLMISQKGPDHLVGWGNKYNEQKCDGNHEIIRHLNTTNSPEWICYYKSDAIYDQLDFAIELEDNSLKFTPTSGLRISFVNHTRYCNRLRQSLMSKDACYATKEKAMQTFVDKLRCISVQLADLRAFFDNETFEELIKFNNPQQ